MVAQKVVSKDSTLDKKINETLIDIVTKAIEIREKQFPAEGYTKETLKLEEKKIIEPAIDALKDNAKKLDLRNLNEELKPTTEVSIDVNKRVSEHFDYLHAVLYGDKPHPAVWRTDKEALIKSHLAPKYRMAEAITATNVPAITFQRVIYLDPSGISRTFARQYTNFQTVGQGTNLVNWYTGDVGDAGFDDVTVGTDITDRTVTVTRVQGTLNHRAMMTKVGYPDIHDIPGDIVNHVNQAITLRAIQDESKFILDTGIWNESGYTPTNWVKGDGSTVTSDVDPGVFTRRALTNGKKKIAEGGFDTAPNNQVVFMRPKAYEELLTETTLNNYFQFAKPEITTTYVVEQIYGTDIEVTNQIPLGPHTATNSIRNVMVTKGLSTAFGSGQDLEIEAQRRNEKSQVFITGRHRLAGKRLLEKSAVRLSSAA